MTHEEGRESSAKINLKFVVITGQSARVLHSTLDDGTSSLIESFFPSKFVGFPE